jgi:CspA family cold shock protein
MPFLPSGAFKFLEKLLGEVRRMEKLTGTVKWFDSKKGYGFITADNGQDVFVHYTGISGTGFRTLEEGERVSFSVMESDKGLKAVDVERL